MLGLLIAMASLFVELGSRASVVAAESSAVAIPRL